MEERKTIEIIDEHGINRKANIMCGIDVAGTDYVVYSIERDSDNDNLFVSKLIKNNDGTHNMINIEDNTEKTKLTDVVKEMITSSVNNENDKVDGDINLANGEKVNIISVLINKAQNINVSKTYITTVKKAVTKVGNDYYQIKDVKPVVESALDGTAPATPATEATVAAPEPTPVVEPVAPVLPEAPVTPGNAPVVEPVAPILSEAPAVAPEPAIPEPTPVVEQVAPILPEAPVVTPDVSIPEPAVVPETPSVAPEAVAPILPEAPSVEPVAPIFETAPVTSEPAPAVSNDVVFDASHESNLNAALNEASDSAAIPVQNVEPIREFGVDTPSTTIPETPQDTGDNPPQSSGFANNKFFMVIAIAFFLASCVFLGYEVFRYFKIVG